MAAWRPGESSEVRGERAVDTPSSGTLAVGESGMTFLGLRGAVLGVYSVSIIFFIHPPTPTSTQPTPQSLARAHPHTDTHTPSAHLVIHASSITPTQGRPPALPSLYHTHTLPRALYTHPHAHLVIHASSIMPTRSTRLEDWRLGWRLLAALALRDPSLSRAEGACGGARGVGRVGGQVRVGRSE